MHITFRTDTSTQIGTGHIMRCLTLADALANQGAQCHFICRAHEGNLLELIKAKGHSVSALPLGVSKPDSELAHAHWLGVSQQEDAQQTIAAMTEHSEQLAGKSDALKLTDWIVVDHYALDYRWESSLAPYTNRILVIDDLADRKHQCNILLDQNLGKATSDYHDLVPENCALLIGPEYALLQPQYAELHPRTPPRQGPVKNILIYFGGSDQHNLTGMATQACLQLGRQDIKLNVVMGSSYPHKEKLEQLAQTNSNLQLHQNLPSLAPLMMQADLAIGAGGSTSWERCCLGLPAVIVTVAENQVPIAQELHHQQIAHWLDNVEEISESKIAQALNHFINSNQELAAYSERGLNLTKGQGAALLAGYILLNKQTQLHARLATLQDETLLLDWANDLQTRQNSFNPNPITAQQHRQWFYKKLCQPEQSKIYITETQGQLPVGQVRFDWQKEKQAWQINYLLAPAARGNGLGTQVLFLALKELRHITNAAIYGEVMPENLKSVGIFRKLGFTETIKDNHLVFNYSDPQEHLEL